MSRPHVSPEPGETWKTSIVGFGSLKVAYLAGPMSGYPGHNYETFAWVTRLLRRQGWDIISPAEVNPGQENAEFSEGLFRECMQKDIHALTDCDAIILLPGWEHSRGAHIEFDLAKRLGHEIYFITSISNDAVELMTTRPPRRG